MANVLELYKSFIDGLVSIKDGVLVKWILEKGYPDTAENKDINELLSSLSEDQKKVLAKLATQARIGGIHDTLAYMNEKMDMDGLVLSQDGMQLPYDAFDSMYYDFISRCEGEEWPE